jgi:hypothetical protein
VPRLSFAREARQAFAHNREGRAMLIDDPAVIAEARTVFDRYEWR